MRSSKDSNGLHLCDRVDFSLRRCLPIETRFFVSLLAITGGAMFHVSAVFGEENHQSTAPSKAKKPAQSTIWDEPSMYPSESDLQDKRPPSMRQSPLEVAETSTEPALYDPSVESSSQHPASTFQTDFGNARYTGASATGLESTRDREALLYLSQRNVTNQPYNIKIGSIPFNLSAGLDIDYTDNSERSNFRKSSELTLLPRIDIGGSIRLTSFASLSLSLGIGYIKYLNHSENDRLLPLAAASLNPEAGLSFNIKIGKFLVNVFDRPQTPQFQADAVTQRNQTQYQQFANVAGVSILWDVNSRTSMTFRYAHSDTISFGSQASGTDASAESFLTSLSCKLSDSLGVGLEAGASTTKHKQSFLNDGTTYHAGPYVNLRASDFLQIEASAGYQGGNYESRGSVGDDSSLGNYYANISISNNLNPRLSHSLSFGHESRSGAFSNSTEVNYIQYAASWDVIRIARIGFHASFEDVQESGGLFAQHLHNFTIGLQSAFQLTKHINIVLAYYFTKREANGNGDLLPENDLDFNENRFSLRLGYTF